MRKILIIGLAAMPFFLSSFAGRQTPEGKAIFDKQCARCHGKEGTKGAFGAKNLQKSVMADEAITQLILTGKKVMPSFKTKLGSNEIKIEVDCLFYFLKA